MTPGIQAEWLSRWWCWNRRGCSRSHVWGLNELLSSHIPLVSYAGLSSRSAHFLCCSGSDQPGRHRECQESLHRGRAPGQV
ncbi:hypothetical protein Cadr_000026311 [Camelus dromedarius]|uniref:Uncharacterized protein n=1 Tax=Camelus dromedarius TaxID=9838 RepID=A0A5N4CES6_CAMDR|nr:hypothetical protein Cadr_000026311 [Camelus dromedarius]